MSKQSHRSVVDGLSYMDEYVTELSIDEKTHDSSVELYRKVATEGTILRGRSTEMVAAACVVYSSRSTSAVVDVEKIVTLCGSSVDQRDVFQTIRQMQSRLDLDLALESADKYVEPISDELDATEHDRELARAVIEILSEQGESSGKKAAAVAGSVFYFISRLAEGDGEFTQKQVAEAANISTVTIRNHYRDFGEVATEHLDQERWG